MAKDFSDTERTSDFNDALGTFRRLDTILQLINESAMNLEIYAWYRGLVRLKQELISDMTDTQRTTMDDKLRTIAPSIINFTKMEERKPAGAPLELCNTLEDIETELRKIHDLAGYKTKRVDAFAAMFAK
jgi:hypothetical protein